MSVAKQDSLIEETVDKDNLSLIIENLFSPGIILFNNDNRIIFNNESA